MYRLYVLATFTEALYEAFGGGKASEDSVRESGRLKSNIEDQPDVVRDALKRWARAHNCQIEDVPVILAARPGRWRARVAPAMLKEFFAAHVHPRDHTWRQWFTNSLNYYLACFYFNTFPIPQREAGARHTLQYMGELTGGGWSILLFPEGLRSATGDIKAFRGGIGMIASRLDVPVIPVRIDDVDKLMPVGSQFVRPGRVRVAFGAPLRLRGDDYAALAAQVEAAVRAL